MFGKHLAIAIHQKLFRTFSLPLFNKCKCCSSISPHWVQTAKISLHEFQLGVKTFFAEEQFSNLHSCVCGNFQNSSKGQRRPLLLVQEKVFFVADFKQREKKCFLKLHPFLLASNGNFFPLEATIMGIMGVEFEKKHALKRKSVKRLFCYHLEKVFYPHY